MGPSHLTGITNVKYPAPFLNEPPPIRKGILKQGLQFQLHPHVAPGNTGAHILGTHQTMHVHTEWCGRVVLGTIPGALLMVHRICPSHMCR